MAIVSAIFSAIAALPKLAEYVERLVAFISLQMEEAKKRQIKKDLVTAIEVAQQKKDTSGLDQIFDPGKKKP